MWRCEVWAASLMLGGLVHWKGLPGRTNRLLRLHAWTSRLASWFVGCDVAAGSKPLAIYLCQAAMIVMQPFYEEIVRDLFDVAPPRAIVVLRPRRRLAAHCQLAGRSSSRR